MNFKKRSNQEELMDDLESSGPIIDQTLKELEIINRLLGGNSVTTKGLDTLLPENTDHIKIADLGCGGGDILKLVAQWASDRGLSVQLYGFDANPHIIKYAEENCADFDNISFETIDIFCEDFKCRNFDIILCTLFTHHFSENDLIRIFHQFKSQAKIGVVINDLHRHWLAYYSIRLLTSLFSKSEMVKFDGPLSVRRAFKKNDFLTIMKKADIHEYTLKWKWAFRWQLIF